MERLKIRLPLLRIHNNGPGGHIPHALPMLIERHKHKEAVMGDE